MTNRETRETIQRLLKNAGFYHGAIDNDFGPKTHAALQALDIADDDSEGPNKSEPGSPVHKVKASSFADPADVAGFRRCKAKGNTDQQCFKVGDNGVGLWGDDTTKAVPMVALPREDWQEKWGKGSEARGKMVLVKVNGKEVLAELRDTMPRRENIKNGAGIDMNPACCAALGLKPPVMVTATWEWA